MDENEDLNLGNPNLRLESVFFSLELHVQPASFTGCSCDPSCRGRLLGQGDPETDTSKRPTEGRWTQSPGMWRHLRLHQSEAFVWACQNPYWPNEEVHIAYRLHKEPGSMPPPLHRSAIEWVRDLEESLAAWTAPQGKPEPRRCNTLASLWGSQVERL